MHKISLWWRIIDMWHMNYFVMILLKSSKINCNKGENCSLFGSHLPCIDFVVICAEILIYFYICLLNNRCARQKRLFRKFIIWLKKMVSILYCIWFKLCQSIMATQGKLISPFQLCLMQWIAGFWALRRMFKNCLYRLWMLISVVAFM